MTTLSAWFLTRDERGNPGPRSTVVVSELIVMCLEYVPGLPAAVAAMRADGRHNPRR